MKRTIEVKFLPKLTTDADQECNMVFDIEADFGVFWIDPTFTILNMEAYQPILVKLIRLGLRLVDISSFQTRNYTEDHSLAHT